VLILLPPSETKSDGGDGPPLELDRLSWPELNGARKQLADDLVALAADLPASRTALGVSARQDSEVARNAVLWTSPTAPALLRYTGVLYDALDYRSLRGAAADRAAARLAVGSALFGLVRASDPVPGYRLSAGSTLPGRTGLTTLWRPLLEPILAGVDELVVDLRSGSYAALGRAPGAVTVTVLNERPDGSRSVVSHFNKAHKGQVARLLAGSRAEPSDARDVARLLRRAGMRIEASGPGGAALELILPA
jgi:cytoplasmic iron level regulating protein YaaA (DUF328/UPF0246 family)